MSRFATLRHEGPARRLMPGELRMLLDSLAVSIALAMRAGDDAAVHFVSGVAIALATEYDTIVSRLPARTGWKLVPLARGGFEVVTDSGWIAGRVEPALYDNHGWWVFSAAAPHCPSACMESALAQVLRSARLMPEVPYQTRRRENGGAS